MKHLAIILDGNRRYAKKLMKKPWEGHELGAKKVESLLEWCKDLGVKELTLYAFSMENFKRDEDEKNFLFKLFENELTRILDDARLDNEDLKINFIGRLDLFSENLQKSMQDLMEKTKDKSKYTVNIAMGYGGRAEIAYASRKIAELVKKGELDPEDIDEKTISSNLYLSSKPDLIIRTGGEKRISNFLVFQAAYSELYFSDKLWPEFEKQDLKDAIDWFNSRDRRFGK